MPTFLGKAQQITTVAGESRNVSQNECLLKNISGNTMCENPGRGEQ